MDAFHVVFQKALIALTRYRMVSKVRKQQNAISVLAAKINLSLISKKIQTQKTDRGDF